MVSKRSISRQIVMLLCGALIASAASAGTLSLTVDALTGQAWIENLSDSTVIFDGYDLSSTGSNFDTTGWVSFQDFTTADPVGAQSMLGNLTWSEIARKTDNLVEFNIANETSVPSGVKLGIGSPVDLFVPDDIVFTYADRGQDKVVTGEINVLNFNPLPWQNASNGLDVNADGSVSPIDALLVINSLNDLGPRDLPVPPVTGNEPPPFFDTDGNNFISPLDALLVINELNSAAGQALAAPEPTTGLLLALGGLILVLRFRRR